MTRSANGRGGAPAAASVAAGTPPHVAAQPQARVPKHLACPICATAFEPRASGGQCPVCGEQVVPAAAVTRQIPGVSPAMRWLADGGWRLVLVLLLAAYQIALLIFVWVQLAHKHLI
ncbi:MAG TPA: hypothetical protein VJQ45_05165 [Ktedonobacterales bacterium]|nr:hypothetical protein [Ktedonobacterales bacterium]